MMTKRLALLAAPLLLVAACEVMPSNTPAAAPTTSTGLNGQYSLNPSQCLKSTDTTGRVNITNDTIQLPGGSCNITARTAVENGTKATLSCGGTTRDVTLSPGPSGITVVDGGQSVTYARCAAPA